MAILGYVFHLLAYILCLIYCRLQLICGFLAKKAPNIVKRIYFQHFQRPAQSVQGFLSKYVPSTVKRIYFQHFQRPAQFVQQEEVDFTPLQDYVAVDRHHHEDQGHLKYFLESIGSILQKVGWSKSIRYHKMVIGNTMNCHEDFLRSLCISPQDSISVDQCDVIIAFVSIVSRAGTDIEAALKNIPGNRPVVFVVLHHTFDPNYIFPESRQAVNRSNVFTVDCLFHEDQGLLKCDCNAKALEATAKYLQDIKMI